MRLDLSGCEEREIAAKAYLSRKDIEELILPERTERIGNWAFAHMKKLERLIVPCRELILGKEILKGCDALAYISVRERETQTDDAGCLLAAAIRLLGAQELLTPPELGSREWMARFDGTVCAFLERTDDSDFQPMWFGGEEDYDDNDTNIEQFRKKRRAEKLELTVLRLIHAQDLEDRAKTIYQEALAHLLTERECWQELVCRFGTEAALIPVLGNAGCLEDRESAMQMLQDICPEGKALLLQHYAGQENGRENCFFSDLIL